MEVIQVGNYRTSKEDNMYLTDNDDDDDGDDDDDEGNKGYVSAEDGKDIRRQAMNACRLTANVWPWTYELSLLSLRICKQYNASSPYYC